MAEESKKKKIYGAVLELFREGKSVKDIKVSEIASRAGIGKGSIYLHFASKDDVILEAVEYFLDVWLKPFREYVNNADKNFKETCIDFINLHIKLFEDYSSLFNPQAGTEYISVFNADTLPGTIESFRNARLEYLDLVEKILNIGMEEKLISYINRYSANMTAEAIMLMVKYIGFRDVIGIEKEERYTNEQCIDLTYDMILRVCK